MKTAVHHPMVVTPTRVKKVIKENHDTYSLILDPLEGKKEFHFKPGQFNMVYLFGVGEVPISISGDPTKPKSIVHTIRAVGNVTLAMQKLKNFDTVGIRGPFGTPWPIDEAKGKDVVLIAGGIGLAPLHPVIYTLLANRKDFGRIVLLFGARTPADLLYDKELTQWGGRFDMDVLVTVDRGDEAWRGNVGVVTTLLKRIYFDPRSTLSMICGPEVMMRFSALELQKRGFSDEQIYISMERNMKCGVGFCGHCQYGPTFICKDGPVYRYDKIREHLTKWEL
ncbi:MAG: FAD/NAD(P)-binding protein [Ignavibacteria bacterium]|nr:FAD/NAD(P)-binding protein [Ignavibacteria bacterium]